MRFLASLLGLTLVTAPPVLPDTVCEAVGRQVFERTNQERQKQSLSPLTWNGVLGEAAINHSQDMCKFDFFSHESPVERRSTPADRVREVGGSGQTCGENIYWSQGFGPDKVPTLALTEWMSDEGHRSNILNKDFHLVGMGVYRKDKAFWITQVFTD